MTWRLTLFMAVNFGWSETKGLNQFLRHDIPFLKAEAEPFPGTIRR
jgi:hypothetical protein